MEDAMMWPTNGPSWQNFTLIFCHYAGFEFKWTYFVFLLPNIIRRGSLRLNLSNLKFKESEIFRKYFWLFSNEIIELSNSILFSSCLLLLSVGITKVKTKNKISAQKRFLSMTKIHTTMDLEPIVYFLKFSLLSKDGFELNVEIQIWEGGRIKFWGP